MQVECDTSSSVNRAESIAILAHAGVLSSGRSVLRQAANDGLSPTQRGVRRLLSSSTWRHTGLRWERGPFRLDSGSTC